VHGVPAAFVTGPLDPRTVLWPSIVPTHGG